MLPNFLLIGAMKCGTSSLAYQLANHPQILMAPRKELDFFSIDENWNRGPAWYDAFFRKVGRETAIGEASASYTMHPMYCQVPARIAETIPDARFIYIVRHPVERIVSNYKHQWLVGKGDSGNSGDVDDSLEAVWESHPQFLACSRYYHQIEQYLPFFPRERFLILAFEEFAADPIAIHRQVYQFLEVEPSFVPTDLRPKYVTAQRIREASWMRAARRIPLLKLIGKSLMPEKLRRRIQQIGAVRVTHVDVSEALYVRIVDALREDVEGLSDFTGRDFRKIWNLKAG